MLGLYLGIILGLYWGNGKENGNYHFRGLGLRGLGLRVQGFGFMVQALEFRVHAVLRG